jgi:hypothetical protein
VRERASFLEAELRAQLDDARRLLTDERAARRAAEAALAGAQAALPHAGRMHIAHLKVGVCAVAVH